MPNSCIYEQTVRDIDQRLVSLDAYRGKILLVVNVATYCGLTPQYMDLERFYQTYRYQGVEVLAFPSDDFGYEPGTQDEIKNFCRAVYNISFALFNKIKVVGAQRSDLFKALATKSGRDPNWNFHKYLIDGTGLHVTSFWPTTRVNSKEFLDVLTSKAYLGGQLVGVN
jgi:glutathione peroxidase